MLKVEHIVKNNTTNEINEFTKSGIDAYKLLASLLYKSKFNKINPVTVWLSYDTNGCKIINCQTTNVIGVNIFTNSYKFYGTNTDSHNEIETLL